MADASINIKVTSDISAIQRTEAGFLELEGAMSRAALAAGDAAGAADILGAATGKMGDLTGKAAKVAADAASAEARLAVAYGDRRGAAERLETALAQISEEDKNRLRLETQLAQIENQSVRALEQEAAAAQRDADAQIKLAQARARNAAAAGDTAGARAGLTGAIATPGASEGAVLSAKSQLIALDKQVATEEQRAADAAVRLAQEQARAAVAAKDHAGALQTLRAAQANAGGASAQAQAALETQITTLETSSTLLGNLSAQFAAFVNPVTLAIGALGAGVAIVKSFSDALDFGAKLEEEQRAFVSIIGAAQDGNAVLGQATAIGKEYGFTQQEIADAFKNLAPIIRESTSTTKEQTEALARISVLKPDAPVQALASAIDGLKKGRFTELAGELGISRDEAKKLTDEVAHGADAFTVLNRILDQHGISLNVAKQRMEGYEGAARRAAIAQENLEKAQARLASGPGTVVTNSRAVATDALTNALETNRLSLDQLVGEAIVSLAVYGRQQQAIDQTTNAVIVNTNAYERKAAVDDLVLSKGAALGGAMDEERRATQQAADASANHAKLLADQAAATLNASQKTQEFATFQKALADIGGAVKAGLITSGEGAIILAGQYDVPIDRLKELIRLQNEASLRQQEVVAKIDFGIARAGATATGKNALDLDRGFFGLPKPGDTAESQAIIAQANQVSQGIQKANQAAFASGQARLNQLTQTGTNQQKINALTQIYNDTVQREGKNSAAAINAQTNLLQEQQRQKDAADRKTKGGGAKGISSADRADLALSGLSAEGDSLDKLQARLDFVNQKLAQANLTALQRKQYTEEQLKLEQKIGDAIQKQNDAVLDARLASLDDKQKRLDEVNRQAADQRVLNSDEFSADQKARAAIEAERIPLEQEKRGRDLAKKIVAGGTGGGFTADQVGQANALLSTRIGGDIALPTLGPFAAAGNVAAPINAAPQGAGGGEPVGVINLDGKQVGTVLMPYLLAALRSGKAQVQAAGG